MSDSAPLTAPTLALPQPPDSLDFQERKFAERLALHANPARAILEAYPGIEQKSIEWQYQKRQILLKNSAVIAYFEQLTAGGKVHDALIARRVNEEMQALGFSRMSDLATWGPDGVKVRDSSELPDNALAPVQEVSIEETTDKLGNVSRRTKLKLAPKNEALANLAKLHGLNKEPAPAEFEFNVQVVNIGEGRR